MGLGYSTTEDIKYDPSTGQLLTKDTWVSQNYRVIRQVVVKRQHKKQKHCN